MGMSDLIEVRFTIPAGPYCERGRQKCRFLQETGNHPMLWCFLVPEASWDAHWNAPAPKKHEKCPSLQPGRVVKRTSEEQQKLNRLAIWQQTEKPASVYCPECGFELSIDPDEWE